MKRLNFVLCPFCTLSLSSASHAAALRTVALTGQQAPGKPDGTVFTSFSINTPLVLNDAGQLAFSARFTDGTSGIFASNRVAVPEPSTFALAAVCVLGLIIRPARGGPRLFYSTADRIQAKEVNHADSRADVSRRFYMHFVLTGETVS